LNQSQTLPGSNWSQFATSSANSASNQAFAGAMAGWETANERIPPLKAETQNHPEIASDYA
jgi:hypothetical protein